MFGGSFSDSAWSAGFRRGWTTLASFALETLAIMLVLFIPLLSTERLSPLRVVRGPAVPFAIPEKPSPLPPKSAGHAPTTAKGPALIAPSSISSSLAISRATSLPLPLGLADTGTRMGSADHPDGGVWGSIGVEAGNVVPPSPKPVPHAERQSLMMEGYLLDRVNPVYPELARIARIQGPVRLRALISKEGRIENLRVLSGQPLLVEAALQAVRRWRYRPYLLNGEKVEVETEVTVNFVLSAR